jgi:hypothetical protein
VGAGRRVHERRRYRAPRAGLNTFLPNGWQISYVSKPDVPFLYHEVLPPNQHRQQLRALPTECFVLTDTCSEPRYSSRRYTHATASRWTRTAWWWT